MRTLKLRVRPAPRGALAGLDYPLPSASGGDLRVPGLGMHRTLSASKRQLSHTAQGLATSKGGDLNTPPGDNACWTAAACLDLAALASRMAWVLQRRCAPATDAGLTKRSAELCYRSGSPRGAFKRSWTRSSDI